MSKTSDLYERARQLIPRGSNLESKRPERYAPGLWPAYFNKASGSKLWDLDGKEYLDMSTSGIGACVLGYANKVVDEAVINTIRSGSASSLNGPEEVELAERLFELHPWAQMARFTRSGGEAMAVAVRIARASTKRDTLLICGYHGWSDWYMAGGGHLKGLTKAGVPSALDYTAYSFQYNDQSGFNRLRSGIGHAAVVMEPMRYTEPAPGFLDAIRDYCFETETPLIFDEISSGFRFCAGGAHLTLGVNPDIAVFSKAMSNGYPMAAVIGRGRVMSAAEESFISSTAWTERTGPAAALATIDEFADRDIPFRLGIAGAQVRAILQAASSQWGVPVTITGRDAMLNIDFGSQKTTTLYTRSMLHEGVLAAGSFYPSAAHTSEDVQKFKQAVTRTFAFLASNPNLVAPIAESGFQRLT